MGQGIKELREELGFKQNAVARRLGISRIHYQRIENGTQKPKAKYLYKLAKIFNCDVAELTQSKEGE